VEVRDSDGRWKSRSQADGLQLLKKSLVSWLKEGEMGKGRSGDKGSRDVGRVALSRQLFFFLFFFGLAKAKIVRT